MDCENHSRISAGVNSHATHWNYMKKMEGAGFGIKDQEGFGAEISA
jgi:hypothetical protein